MMDSIAILKGRMAEALVEAVFKRAGYTVARVGRETQMPALVRTGRAEFMPDFVVWRPLDDPSLGHHSYRLVAIEVKYRVSAPPGAAFGESFICAKAGLTEPAIRPTRQNPSARMDSSLPLPWAAATRAGRRGSARCAPASSR